MKINKKWWEKQQEKAKDFKLSAEDIHNLYDLFYMTNWIDYKTIHLNALREWYERFFDRLDEFCIGGDEI